MDNDIILTMEKDPILLQKYGLAMGLLSMADYLLGELIRLFGGLHKAHAELVNALMDDKTMGRKIGLVRELPISNELRALFQPSLEDRNLLAHGISVQQGDVLRLMHKTKLVDLTHEMLDGVITRARALNLQIVREIQTKFKPMANPPPNSLTGITHGRPISSVLQAENNQDGQQKS